MNPMELIIKGLKCDAPGCSYLDPNAFLDEALIGQPCPLCGANLLTAADFAGIKAMQALVDWGNVVNGPVPDGSEQVFILIEMDGSGFPVLRDEEPTK